MRLGSVLFVIVYCLAAQSAPAADVPQPKAPVITAPTVQAPVAPKPVVPEVAIDQTPQPSGKARLTPVQQQHVAQRVPLVKKQLEGLSADEQRAILRKAAPPRKKLTDAERAARGRATRAAWAAKTPAQKTELRQKYLAAWQKLSPEDRAYRRARMTDQLQALPEADRKAVIAPFTSSNVPSDPAP